jgi:transcriptional regulator with XRE-family HTH domain
VAKNQLGNRDLRRIGRLIRCKRIALKLSQEAIASASDLDRAYFGRVERGEANVSCLNLIKIARALKTNARDLI